jgi:hypothetical protein
MFKNIQAFSPARNPSSSGSTGKNAALAGQIRQKNFAKSPEWPTLVRGVSEEPIKETAGTKRLKS